MPERETKEVCAGCERLKRMVKVLSALVDIQELPRGFTMENYKRLMAGKRIRLRKPIPVVRVGKDRNKRIA
jgi:hypothetical protein